MLKNLKESLQLHYDLFRYSWFHHQYWNKGLWIAHHLPRFFRYFIVIDACARVTTGPFSDKTPDEVNIMQLLKEMD